MPFKAPMSYTSKLKHGKWMKKIEALEMDERLLTFVIAWVLALRVSNHAQLSKDDMMLIHYLKSGI